MIELEHIVKTHHLGSDTVHAVDDVSLTIRDGEYLAIVGPSGSGKSSLMNIIGLLDTPDSGSYLLDGMDVFSLSHDELARARNHKIGFVFQQFNLLSSATALDNVMLPLMYAGLGGGHPRERALELLALVGLDGRAHHMPHQLSGGQQQRVAIARALACEPEILLADEPTGALDSHTSREIMDTFDELNRNGQTIVLITHDPGVAERAGRVVGLTDGRLVEDQRRGLHAR